MNSELTCLRQYNLGKKYFYLKKINAYVIAVFFEVPSKMKVLQPLEVNIFLEIVMLT